MAERPQVLRIPPRGEEEQAEDEAAGPDMNGALLTGFACRPATHGPLIVCGRARGAQAPARSSALRGRRATVSNAALRQRLIVRGDRAPTASEHEEVNPWQPLPPDLPTHQ